MSAGVAWVSVVLDLDAPSWDVGVAFWSAVTGYAAAAPWGADAGHAEHAEHAGHAALVPPAGDGFIEVQRLGTGPRRVHVDLHVADPGATALEAVSLGAHVVARPGEGHVVLASPAGVTVCLVDRPASVRPPPADWGGHRSVVDQLTLDVAEARHAAEVAFWTELTGWDRRPSSSPTMAAFSYAPGLPVRLMVQQVGDDRSPATAHLDLSCSDRAAETARHLGLGASVLREEELFTGMVDPTGAAYCLTDRDPGTGLLARR